MRALLAARARAGSRERELLVRRRLGPLLVLEHATFVFLLASGAVLMRAHGWGLGHARWLDVKLGLVAFLVLPLEAMHAFAAHVWIARGLRRTSGPEFPRDLERGLAMEEMVTALSALLLGAALPLIVWLSVAKPF